MSAKRYTAYGLSIRSEIALPLPPAPRSGAQVSIRMGTVPETLGGSRTGRRVWQAAPGAFLMAVDGVARYLVREGREITVEPAPGGGEAVAPILLGSVLAACLKQRGILTLHASAIATDAGAVLFSGHSGRGKSTLLAALVQRGYPMLCDDVAGIAPEGGDRPLALPAYPRLRLWGDAVEALGWNGRPLGRVREGMDKFLAPVERFGKAPLPVRAVFVLRFHGRGDIEIEPAAPALAFKCLLRRVYRRRYARGLGRAPEQFRAVAELARRAPVTLISNPVAAIHPAAIEALASRVEDCLSGGRGAARATAAASGGAGAGAVPGRGGPGDSASGPSARPLRHRGQHGPGGAGAGPIVWLASYPKSGNTWLRALLTNFLNGGEPACINALLGGPAAILREEFDERLGLSSSDLAPEEILRYRSRLHELLGADSPHRSFVKVHDACLRTAGGALLFPPGATYGAVYLVRNPLDVAVSCAHHWDWPIGRAVAELCRPDAALSQQARGIHHVLPQPLLDWSGHVASWLEQRELPVHVVRYEDLLADPEAAFAGILRFTGLDPDAGRVARAVAHSRIERLRAQEERSGFEEKPLACRSFFRAGRAGTWRDALAPEQVRALTAAHAGAMDRFGYLAGAEAFLKQCAREGRPPCRDSQE